MAKEENEKEAKEAEEGQAEEIQEKPAEAAKETGTEEAKTEETLEELLKEEEPTEKAAETEEEAPAEAKEEERPAKEEKAKKKEEEIVEERIYTVPLGKAWIMPPNKRAPRAIRMLKVFITKHMKLAARKEAEGEEEEEAPVLVISNEVNERVWGRGIQKPPRKLRVRAAKDKEGNVTVYLAEGD
jgi:large subunit ribosomal protein L31e